MKICIWAALALAGCATPIPQTPKSLACMEHAETVANARTQPNWSVYWLMERMGHVEDAYKECMK
jgi:hypothetical protein